MEESVEDKGYRATKSLLGGPIQRYMLAISALERF
jgi:hypothetical protein